MFIHLRNMQAEVKHVSSRRLRNFLRLIQQGNLEKAALQESHHKQRKAVKKHKSLYGARRSVTSVGFAESIEMTARGQLLAIIFHPRFILSTETRLNLRGTVALF